MLRDIHLMLRIMIRTALLSLAFTGMSAMAKSPADQHSTAPISLKPLLSLINERLEIADAVALTKWDSGQPVQDSDREATVIVDAQQQAEGYAITKKDAAQFMAAQIEANKLVQYGLLAMWHADGKAPATQRPDLTSQIRPRLDKLQMALLQQYAKFSPQRTDPACHAWLSQAIPLLAADGLHEMALIRATGELCAPLVQH
ncbi:MULTISPECIES: chorismate mutase [unclassified Pseudomonas]|uniref:chorismate mutase n=1 Tax=unclassified Pseudomonas TaxID=196821 RepID=UPI000D355471|nr:MULTISPECIES: chorismate mutase [unclassified Pseudomonas]RAU47993.1 chorismate mutase [Pseudomonas sp. RIT 409]RAU55313.1 chorismate mutase [Pseudomonas sp. RIT 412]